MGIAPWLLFGRCHSSPPLLHQANAVSQVTLIHVTCTLTKMIFPLLKGMLCNMSKKSCASSIAARWLTAGCLCNLPRSFFLPRPCVFSGTVLSMFMLLGAHSASSPSPAMQYGSRMGFPFVFCKCRDSRQRVESRSGKGWANRPLNRLFTCFAKKGSEEWIFGNASCDRVDFRPPGLYIYKSYFAKWSYPKR